MKKFFVGNIFFYTTIFFIVSMLLTRTVYAEIIITEIMYDPPGADKGNEWVEIMNDSNATLDVQDFRFFEADTKHLIKEGSGSMTMAPGETAVIAQDSALFKDVYKTYQGSIFLSSFSLRQQKGVGEALGIYSTADDQIISKITYTPDDRAAGTGASLHLTLGGTQVPAPATPGVIAINPIPAQDQQDAASVQEEIHSEENIQDGRQHTTGKTQSSSIADTVIRSLDDRVSAEELANNSPPTPQRQVTVVQGGGDYTFILRLITALLVIIVLELWVIARRLRRTRRHS